MGDDRERRPIHCIVEAIQSVGFDYIKAWNRIQGSKEEINCEAVDDPCNKANKGPHVEKLSPLCFESSLIRF